MTSFLGALGGTTVAVGSVATMIAGVGGLIAAQDNRVNDDLNTTTEIRSENVGFVAGLAAGAVVPSAAITWLSSRVSFASVAAVPVGAILGGWLGANLGHALGTGIDAARGVPT